MIYINNKKFNNVEKAIEEMLSEYYYKMDIATNIATFLFRSYGWEWGGLGVRELKIPSHTNIMDEFERLAKEIIKTFIEDKNETLTYHSTGRLLVLGKKDNDGKVTLEFNINL